MRRRKDMGVRRIQPTQKIYMYRLDYVFTTAVYEEFPSVC